MPQPPPLFFDHLGIVVPDLAEGRRHLTRTLGITRWTAAFDDYGIGVSVQFGASPTGSPTTELIAPLGERSPVAGSLRKGTRILSHIAYFTADLDSSAAHLTAEGCAPTGPAHAAVAYHGQRVQFFISPFRFMIELIESTGTPESHQHAFADAQPEPTA